VGWSASGFGGDGIWRLFWLWCRASTAREQVDVAAIATAAGSAGQVFGGTGMAEWLLGFLSWQADISSSFGRSRSWRCFWELWRVDGATPAMASKAEAGGKKPVHRPNSLGKALRRDFRHYLSFLSAFSACGWVLVSRLAFIHRAFPRRVDRGLRSGSLPVRLLHNIGITIDFGALARVAIFADWSGQHRRPCWRGGPREAVIQEIPFGARFIRGVPLIAGALSYAAITPVIAFILFSSAWGALWAGNGAADQLVWSRISMGRVYGHAVGIGFSSHQLGSFLGVWLGGADVRCFGDYTVDVVDRRGRPAAFRRN